MQRPRATKLRAIHTRGKRQSHARFKFNRVAALAVTRLTMTHVDVAYEFTLKRVGLGFGGWGLGFGGWGLGVGVWSLGFVACNLTEIRAHGCSLGHITRRKHARSCSIIA